jgi:hypothetical protein
MSVFRQLPNMRARYDYGKQGPTLLRQFWELVRSPVRGARYVIDASPDLGGLAIALAVLGLLRGITEGYWFYLMTGTHGQLPRLLTQELWYIKYGGPFRLIVSNSTT